MTQRSEIVVAVSGAGGNCLAPTPKVSGLTRSEKTALRGRARLG
jgi:hypothetical protein